MKKKTKKTQVLSLALESTCVFWRYFQIQRAMLSLKSKMGKTSHDRFPKFMLLSRQ